MVYLLPILISEVNFHFKVLTLNSKINFASISEREEIKLTLLYLMLMIRSKLILKKKNSKASSMTQMIKNVLAMWETGLRSLGWEDPLEKGMATRSSILAWRIPWTEEPVGLQSMGLQSQTRLSN